MSPQDVGRTLREQREQRGLPLERAAQATHIRKHYLQALEDGNLGALPSAAQVRGFLRAYAQYLELDAEALLVQLREQPSTEPQPETVPQPAAAKAGEISSPGFAAVGAQLGSRREQMELTLDEVEENTHISAQYLQRLERGDFDSFPSPTQARGMLGNYADFLGLESEALLLQYAEALQARFQERAAAKPEKTPKPKRPAAPPLKFRLPEWAQPLLTRDIAFGALAGLLLISFILFSINRVLGTRVSQAAEPTAPALGSLLLPSATPEPSNGAAGSDSVNLLAQTTATPGLLGQTTIEAGSGNINLRLLATQRVWMRVSVDGSVQFEGRTRPGQSYTFSANGQIVLLTGNGAGLRAFLNDQDVGIVGVLGEVVSVLFNAQGVATPTPSPMPTADPNVLTATAEAALSATPSPSATQDPGGLP